MLGDDVQEVLSWASVVGRSFSFEVLAACCPLPDDRVLDALDLAVEASLVEEHAVGHYSFSHALVRSALYDGCPGPGGPDCMRRSPRRSRTVDRPGGVPAAELAHHYLTSGDPAYLDVAIGYARQAATDALAQLGYGEAAAVTRRAIGAVKTTARRDHALLGPLMLDLGDALSRSGDTVGARAAYLDAATAARHEQQPSWLGRQPWGTPARRGRVSARSTPRRSACWRRPWRRPRGPGCAAVPAAVRGWRWSSPSHGNPSRSRAQRGRADHRARTRRPRCARSSARGAALGPVASRWHRRPRRPRRRPARCRPADGNGEMAVAARRWRLVALLEAGRIEEVWAETERHEDDARRLGLPYELMYVAVFATMRALLEGRIEDAQAGVRARHDLRRAARRRTTRCSSVACTRSRFAVLTGRIADLVEPIRAFVEAYPAIPAWRGALATALAAAGRPDEAADEVALIWPPEVALPYDAVQLLGLCFLGDGRSLLGDADRARHLYELLRPYARRPVVIGAGGAVIGTVDLDLAQLAATYGDHDTAGRHLETAAQDLAGRAPTSRSSCRPQGLPSPRSDRALHGRADLHGGRTIAARWPHGRPPRVRCMPTTTTLLVFVPSTLALLAVPGPSVVYVVTRTLEQGRRAGLVSMLGLETGALVHVALSALGVTALLAASDWAFLAVKYAGATYLVVLGMRQLRRRPAGAGAADSPTTSEARLFRDGVLVDLLNPKTGLFFLAFLPQFVEPVRGPVAGQVLVLGVCFVVLAALTDGTYALVTSVVRTGWPGVAAPPVVQCWASSAARSTARSAGSPRWPEPAREWPRKAGLGPLRVDRYPPSSLRSALRAPEGAARSTLV